MSLHHRAAWAVTSGLILTIAGIGVIGPSEASSGSPSHRASSAGTLVFVKDHNVWLANGDGSDARPLTGDGTATSPYTSPSQSNNGVIVAGRLDEIVRMDQAGQILNRMNPAPLPSSVSGHTIDGNLQEVAISPDGSTLAYSMTKYLSPPGASSGYRTATGYTPAASFADPAPRGLAVIDLGEPSWVGNVRTLQSGGYGSHVMVDDLDPNPPAHWFDDEDIYSESTDLGNAELAPDGRHLAAVRGSGDESFVIWYRVDGDATVGAPPAPPTPVCEIGPTAISDPTWAPDSDSLAWVEADGIWARSGVEDCTVPSQLLIPGGSQPDWSPAPLAPPKKPDGPRHVTNLQRPTITGKALVGRRLVATPGRWTPTPVKTVFRWKRNGKAIKGADERRYRLTRTDRGRRITVTVTATRSGWKKAVATSKPVRVRR